MSSSDGDDGRAVGRAGTPAQGRELRARGQRTMRRLLDAGITVFAARGYHSARVDDIVKAAKTSHGTFYLYFANKEDLFQALVADVATEIAALTASLGALGPGDDGKAELRAWLAQFAEMYEHYGPVIRTWTEAELDSSEAGRIGTDVLGELTTALAEQRASGRIRRQPPTCGHRRGRDDRTVQLLRALATGRGKPGRDARYARRRRPPCALRLNLTPVSRFGLGCSRPGADDASDQQHWANRGGRSRWGSER